MKRQKGDKKDNEAEEKGNLHLMGDMTGIDEYLHRPKGFEDDLFSDRTPSIQAY